LRRSVHLPSADEDAGRRMQGSYRVTQFGRQADWPAKRRSCNMRACGAQAPSSHKPSPERIGFPLGTSVGTGRTPTARCTRTSCAAGRRSVSPWRAASAVLDWRTRSSAPSPSSCSRCSPTARSRCRIEVPSSPVDLRLITSSAPSHRLPVRAAPRLRSRYAAEGAGDAWFGAVPVPQD